MKFEQVDKGNVITMNEQPKSYATLPEIGKVYPCYDDGKVRITRLDFYKITKIVKIEELPQEIFNEMAEEIKECYWLFAPEQTEAVFATLAYGKDRESEEVIFIRSKYNFWFSIGLFGSHLDMDGRLTKELFTDPEYGIPRREWRKMLRPWSKEAYKLVCDICNR